MAGNATTPVSGIPFGGQGRRGFFARRWRCEIPLAVLFWRDTIVIASVLNLATAFAALMALGFKAPLWVAWAIFLAPVPYNLFLAACIWRSADRAPTAGAAAIKTATILWLAVATII